MTSIESSDKIKLAVVTGGHPFDVPAFRDLFFGISDVDPYIQDLDNWAVSRVFDQYDAFLFFNMHSEGVLSVRKGMAKRILNAINRLGESQQGIFVLHHALLAFPDLDSWSDVCNVDGRRLNSPGHSFTARTDLDHEIPNPDHPITRGLEPWTMNTEGFLIDDAREGSDVLLTTSNPNNAKTLAWTHQYKNARVFCYHAGHDPVIWNNPSFYTVLTRGIRWVAGRI